MSWNFYTKLLYTVCPKRSVNPLRKQTKQRCKQIFSISLQNSRHPLQHTFDNVRTASGNNQQMPRVESIAERLSHDLWWHSRPQNVHLWWPPSRGEKRKKSAEVKLGEKGGWSSTATIFWARIWRTRIALCVEALSWNSIHFRVLYNSGRTHQIRCSNRFKTAW